MAVKFLLLDLDVLQKKTQHGGNVMLNSRSSSSSSDSHQVMNRSWPQAVKDTIKVAKPQLINIMATFMMLVMSMQVMTSRRELRKVEQEKEEVEKGLSEVQKMLNQVRSLEFAEGLVHQMHVSMDGGGGGEEDGVSSWSPWSILSRRRRKQSSMLDRSENVDDTMAECIQKEIFKIVGAPMLSSDKNEVVEVDPTKLLIDELVKASAPSPESIQSEDEVIRVEDGKVLKRKKFIM